MTMRYGAVLFEPLCFQTRPAYARRGGADLVLRLQCNALRLKAAMIDPRVDVALGKRAVHMIGPALAPLLAQRGLVPFAHLCRSEERRVGKECVSTCRSRWSPHH